MNFVYVIAGLGAVTGGIHYSGMLDRGSVYAKPYSVVYAELVSMPVPEEARSMVGGAVRMTEAPGRIEWHFSNSRGEIAVFTAELTREDNRHTRVKVDFDIGDVSNDAGGDLLSADLIRSTARSAMAEQLDARLSGRPFDQAKMGRMLGKHLRDHPEELKAFGQGVENMFKGASDHMNAEGGGAFAHVSAGGNHRSPSTSETMAAATRPTTRFPSN